MRPRCSKCEFILERCLCDVLSPVCNETEIIILQHPSEKNHALNTVRIMKRSFSRLHLFVGENFDDEAELINLLQKKKTALLFPGENSSLLTRESAAPFSQLILLDGTWKKAKKIFYSSSILHSLPRLSIMADIKSQYRIRRSSLKNSYSTLEAAVAALNILEPDLNCESATMAFLKMIDFQIEKMGSDVYEKNYSQKKGDE